MGLSGVLQSTFILAPFDAAAAVKFYTRGALQVKKNQNTQQNSLIWILLLILQTASEQKHLAMSFAVEYLKEKTE